MKIKHYRAPDMRQALRQVREAQGPDAVIVSSRRVSGGVEVVAAIDYDAAETDGRGSGFSPTETSRTEVRPTQTELGEPPGGLNEELRTLRRMLETQLATLAWNDLSRRAPTQTELLKQLTQLGLAQDLATELVTQLPSRLELSEAYRLALALLARRIETAGERWLETGGVVALVGATGVGKTTLMAKLAARWVLRHGQRDIAVISTDSVRIGAHHQIQTLGRLLGVPAYAVEGPQALPELLDQLGDQRLVLIDTAGLSQRDPRLAADLRALSAASDRLETALVTSAAAQAGAIEEAFETFAAAAQPTSCILTKLDEATSLGGTLSALVRSKLPLAYVSDGQRVPEDLNPARAHQLLARAVELSRKAGATADEDLLRRRFGAVAHALA